MNPQIVNFFKTILPQSPQLYESSCAASAMDLICKHERIRGIDSNFFQDTFKNINVGFTQLKQMSELTFTIGRLNCDELHGQIKHESNNGRLVLVSIPWGYFTCFSCVQNAYKASLSNYHIWIGFCINDNVFVAYPRLRDKGDPVMRDFDFVRRLHAEAVSIQHDFLFECASYIRS